MYIVRWARYGGELLDIQDFFDCFDNIGGLGQCEDFQGFRVWHGDVNSCYSDAWRI